jgi:serine/threonine protein kinase
VLGEGGNGRVRTLHDLPDGPLQVVSVDVEKAQLLLEPTTRELMVARYALDIVFKEMLHAQARPVPAPDSRPGGAVTMHMEQGRRSLASVMREWAPREVEREERGKWELFSAFIRRAVQLPPVTALMPLHRNGRRLFLAIRAPGGLVLPLYRYMDGDLRLFSKRMPARVQHVVAAVRSAINCLSMLVLYAGVHHCDVKPQNILFRVADPATPRPPASSFASFFSAPPPSSSPGAARPKPELAELAGVLESRPGAATFVLSDYGSCVMRPTLQDLDTRRGTPGFVSPVATGPGGREHWLAEFRAITASSVHYPGPGLEAEAVWDSYEPWLAGRARGDLSPYDAFVKNDLYALGVTMLTFAYPPSARALPELARRLVLGSGGSVDRLLGALTGLKQAVREVGPEGLRARVSPASTLARRTLGRGR